MNGLRVLSYGLPECIDQVVTRSGWKERKGKLPKGRGLGVACSHYVSGAANSIIRSDMPHSTVNIKIDRDGGVVVYTGASEIGQGSDTMTAQVVAEVLGCGLARVRVIAADTDLTPIDLGSYSSRVTFMAGNAALRAAEDVKKNIVSAAAKRMNCASGRCHHARRSRVQARRGAGRTMSRRRRKFWRKKMRRADAWMGRFCAARSCRRVKKKGPKTHMSFEEAVVSAIDFHGALTGTGSYAPPMEARGGKHKGGGVGPSPAYSYSAQVAEVSVDEETGEVTVHKIWAAHDCGRALNPVAVRRTGDRLGVDGSGAGAGRRDGVEGRPADESRLAGVSQPVVAGVAGDRVHHRREHRSRKGRLARRKPAKARWRRPFRRSQTRSTTLWESDCVRAPFTPERILSALRAKKGMKRIEMTESVDPTAPARFREHGGSLWFKGKGPMRHPLDPARQGANAASSAGGEQ